MFYNEEIAESCPDSVSDEVDESDTTAYLSNSLNYITGLGSGWLGNIWEKAKEKSNVALTTTKRDLTEFVTVIHRDTSNAVSVVGDSAIAFTEKIVQSADGRGESDQPQNSGRFGRLFESLLNPCETQYTPYKERLEVLQSSLSTYTTEYDGEEYSNWISDFTIDNFKDRISEMLVENSEVKRMHSKLVPSVVSYSLFWRRYFYRENMLRKEEERSEILRNKENQFDWDSDSDIATPTNTRKKFNINVTVQDSPSSSISFQQIGSPNVEDLDSDDSKESSNSRQENGSSADSFVSIDEPEERVVGSISTKDILEQKIAMIANVKITSSHDSSADTSSDSIMVIEPPEIEVSPQQSRRENNSQTSVIEFIQNMTVGSPIKPKNTERNEDWPDWDD